MNVKRAPKVPFREENKEGFHPKFGSLYPLRKAEYFERVLVLTMISLTLVPPILLVLGLGQKEKEFESKGRGISHSTIVSSPS